MANLVIDGCAYWVIIMLATSRRRRSCKMNTMNLMMVPGLDNSKNLRAIRMESKKKMEAALFHRQMANSRMREAVAKKN